jgi:hypothetical protein
MRGTSRWCATAVPETGLMTDLNLAGAERMSVGHRVGGCEIHFPAVVCTSSPSMPKSIWLGPPSRFRLIRLRVQK